VHQCDPLDVPAFHTRVDQVNGFANPAELDHLTFGVRRNLSGNTARCAPSGYIELRLEQIIMLKKPMSTRSTLDSSQAPPVVVAGAHPGGGGMFPQSMMNKGGAIGVAAASLHIASQLSQ